jgi:hypothetical protein
MIYTWFKKTVIGLVCFSLVFLVPLNVYADAKQRAEDIINLSQEAARLTAESLFRAYLLDGFQNSVFKAEELANVIMYFDSVNNILAKRIDELNKLQFLVLEAEQIEKELQEGFASHEKLKEALKLAQQSLRLLITQNASWKYQVNLGEIAALDGANITSEFLGHFKEMCDKGVAAEFLIPNLPPINIQPPQFEFGFQFTMGLDGDTVSSDIETKPYGSTSLAHIFGDDPDAQEKAAALTALTTATIAQVLMYLYPAMSSMVAGGWAALVVFVIVAIVYTFEFIKARKEAKDQADAVERSVKLKANSSTVTEIFKNICQNEGAALLKLAEEVESGSEVAGPSEKDIEFVVVFSTKMDEYSVKLQEKINSFKDEGLTGDELQKKIHETAEYKELSNYINNKIGLKGLIRVIKTQLISLSTSSEEVLSNVVDLKSNSARNEQNIEFENRMEILGGKIRKLYGLSYAYSVDFQVAGAFATLREEMRQEKVIADIYLQYQKVSSKYLRAVLNGLPAISILKDAEMLQKQVATELSTRENSELLRMIQLSLNRIVGFNP